MQHVAQLRMAGDAGREIRAVSLPERGNERIAVLPADLAILVAMAVVEAWLLHGHYLPPRGWCLCSGFGDGTGRRSCSVVSG